MRHWIAVAAAAALLWPTMAGAATPEEMAQSVAQTLKESGKLKGYAVGVKYEDGVAWLEGRVTSEEQAQIAVQLANEVEGIDHVVNKLAIVAPKPVAKKPAKVASKPQAGDLMQTLMEEPVAAAAPAPLPPNPQAMPAAPAAPARKAMNHGMPRPIARTASVQANMPSGVQAAQYAGGGTPRGYSTAGARGVSYDQANMPNYAWPSYAAHPNYAAVSYPTQYSPAAWPYIGPFHPYPQVPLGWRKVTLEWDDGWWFLDFSHQR